MTAQASATPVFQPAAAPATTANLTETEIVISLAIHDPDDPDLVGVTVVNQNQRFLQIPNGFDGAITWNLDGENTSIASFDNPPLTVNGNQPNAMLVTQSAKSISVHWINDSETAFSYYYTIQVFVQIGELIIPISHDPTVHNEPPTP